MRLIAGIDVGNATTEVALADISAASAPRFLASASVPTTGIKGTVRNIPGIVDALRRATQAVESDPLGRLTLVLLERGDAGDRRHRHGDHHRDAGHRVDDDRAQPDVARRPGARGRPHDPHPRPGVGQHAMTA